jgi:hypothetical protein
MDVCFRMTFSSHSSSALAIEHQRQNIRYGLDWRIRGRWALVLIECKS